MKGWFVWLFFGICVVTGTGCTAKTVSAEKEIISGESSNDMTQNREIVTENWTVINGRRLDFMMKYMGESVNFEKSGINLEIPGKVVSSWKVEENQTIQVLIRKISHCAYEIKIYKGDQEITEIPDSQVRFCPSEVFPYEEAERIRITDSQGEEAIYFFDGKTRLLTVKTDQTGIFYVKSRKSYISQKPYIQIILIGITGVAAGIHSRFGKRGESHKKER